MVGIASFRVANAGRVIAFLQQPVILGGLASAIVVTVLLARPPRPPRKRPAATARSGVLTAGDVDP
jgi:hypothetical protein